MSRKVGQSEYIVRLGSGQPFCVILNRETREDLPIYKQIADELLRQVEEGHLVEGSRLPPVRQLAKDLEVTRVTVHKAYSELRDQGRAEARVGRGTYLIPRPAIQTPLDSLAYAPRDMTPDKIMADISILKEQTQMISLAMAEPDPAFSPAASFLNLFRSFEDEAPTLLSYGPYQGSEQLRHVIAGLLREKGMTPHPDELIITTGVTQGLSLSLAALCERGDRVLVEQPTYLGFLSLLRSFGLQPIGIPVDEEGIDIDIVETMFRLHRPKVLYTIPHFQNPSGVSLSTQRRERLVSLAASYDVTIIEDDVYGQLHYDGPVLPSLYAHAQQSQSGAQVIYLNSFSKTLFPGLRIGYMLPPASMKEQLMAMVRCRELCGSPLMHRALFEFLRRGLWHQHLQKVLPHYRSRRDTLLHALQTRMPEEVSWSQPKGGFCCWLTLPAEGQFETLYQEALAQHVAFTPGVVFSTPQFGTEPQHWHLRLCFGTQPEDTLVEAITILSQLIHQTLKRPLFDFPPSTPASPVV
jgi:DNA-binding transcriptional MocR family regulator